MEKRSVARDVLYGLADLPAGFVGYEKLLELCSQLKEERERALFAAIFLTGGRINEVLELRKKNFVIEENRIIVKRMKLSKRYEKIGEFIEYKENLPETKIKKLFKYDERTGRYFRKRYKTQKKTEFRPDFAFPRNEPLANILVNYLNKIEKDDDLLFPSPQKKLKKYPMSRVLAWQILQEVVLGHDENGKEVRLYPHWLRAQRACCLISFYEMRMEEMMEWFGWEELTTARAYAKFGIREIGAKMLMKSYPEKAKEIEEKILNSSEK